MPSLKPNARVIASAINGPRLAYTVDGHQGLGLAVRGNGQASWTLRYRVGGKQREHVLHSDARNADFQTIIAAKMDWLAAVKVHGVDPKAEREAQAAAAKVEGLTFDKLFHDWLERHAKIKKRSWKNDVSQYNCHVKPRLGSRCLTDISRRDIVQVLSEIADTASGVMANRSQAMISAIYSWAQSMELVGNHPALRIPKFGIETVRERVLTDAEINAVWNALQSIVSGRRNGMTVQTARMIQLLMLTGARRSEVARATKSEVAGNLWTIPASRMKNKRPHSVPLAPMAAKLYAEAKSASRSDTYVFTGRGSECADPTSIGRSLDKLTADLGIDDAHPHDLRRTLASGLGRMGVPEETISRVLAHAKQGVTQRHYNLHSYDPEKLTALRLWSAHLTEIAQGRKPRGLRWR